MHKGLGNSNYTLADWNEVEEEFIRKVVQAEGKRVIAEVLGMSYSSFTDWFKYRKIDIPVVRNFNYYNARKPEAEREPYQTELSLQLKEKLDEIRARRLEVYKDKIEQVERICPTCGKVFMVGKDSTQKYCSAECVSNRERSVEEKEKLSMSCMGRKAWNKGIPLSVEAKEKMKETMKLTWTDEKKKVQQQRQKEVWSDKELRERHSKYLKSLVTEESRENISRRTKEAMNTEEVRYNIELGKTKSIETKIRNNSFNKSEPEDVVYGYLCDKFKDVIRQYRSEVYPFACDFYIPELDLYIEYQGTWTHGNKPYDETDVECITLVNKWKERNTKFYRNAIKTYTVRDPRKRKVVKENGINWIEFFTIEEFMNWYNER